MLPIHRNLCASLLRATVVCLALGNCFSVTPATAEDGWISLSDSLESFRQPMGEWFVAGNARPNPHDARRLTGDEGSGVLINGRNGKTDNLVTRRQWGDIEVSLEFMIPRGSNSGVKLCGLYEIQIMDTAHVARPKGSDCGGIYPRAEFTPKYHHIDEGIAPLVNAAKGPGEWQRLEIIFRVPRFDQSGEKTTNARFERVTLNGKLIHDDVEVAYPTGNLWREKEVAAGPLYFQGDHGPVAFRNMRVRPLPDGSAAFSGK